MARSYTLVLLSVLVVFSAGCPPRNYEFTNANLNGDRNIDYGSPTADAAEGEGENETKTREVVEPDVYYRAGDILYVLNQSRGLALIDLEANAILCRVATYGMPRDLYVAGGRAYVLVSNATDYSAEGNTVSCAITSRLYVVDIEDPEAAEIVSHFDFEGDLIDSRVVGDILYAICAERPWWWGWGWRWGAAEDGVVSENETDAIVQTWVTSINIADPENIYEADEVSFESLGKIIHCTNTALFVAAEDVNAETVGTLITYVDISDPDGDITVRDTVRVNGYVADRYKMDAYEGVLRVVAALGQQWMGNSGVVVSCVDLTDPDNLGVIGSTELEGAVDETLFATRFDGPRGYVVTYKVVDPLFVLDLSDPTNPTLLGELIVPGWSTHIEPRGDRLIALGVDDTDGKRRVCVSLFDVAAPAGKDAPWTPVLLDRVTFGENWSWSTAQDDVKAFSVLDDLLLVPFNGWENEDSYNRLQFVTYTQDDLEARGYCDQRGSIVRSFEYDGLYYCITDRQLAVMDASDLDDPEIVDRVVISENVYDYLQIGPDTAVEIVKDPEDPVTIVRLHGLEKKATELELKLDDLVCALPYGQNVVLVGATYWDTPHYTVAIVDCASDAAPALIDKFEIKVNPCWDYYYYDYPALLEDAVRPLDAGVKAGKDLAIGWWWWPQMGQNGYILGDKLVLRCRTSDYDVYFGSNNGYMFGLALVNLDEAEYTTVGLGFANIVSVEAAGNSVYIGTRTDLFSPLQAECAYYLRELNVQTLLMGPAVNVPGAYIDYLPAEDLLFVRDDQWDGSSGDVTSSLRTVRWAGGATVTPLDSIELPPYAYDIVRGGNNFYATTYSEGTVLFTASVDDDGDLHKGPKGLVTQDWAYILGARAGVVYMTVNSAVVRYEIADEDLVIEGIYPTMSYPTGIRFGADYDFVCLGYSGVLTLPR